jgi:hypothetical protein
MLMTVNSRATGCFPTATNLPTVTKPNHFENYTGGDYIRDSGPGIITRDGMAIGAVRMCSGFIFHDL